MHRLSNEIAQYYGRLESLIYLRPELELMITWVARLLNALDQYLVLHEAQQHMDLCRLMAFEHDYSQSVAFVVTHLTEVYVYPSASPGHRLCIETLLALCGQCLDQALELYEVSERHMVSVASNMPMKAGLVLQELERARAALWKFQYMFHLGQPKRYVPDVVEVAPNNVDMPWIFDKASPMSINTPSPVRFAFSQAYAALGVGKYGRHIEQSQGNGTPEEVGSVSLSRRLLQKQQAPTTRKSHLRQNPRTHRGLLSKFSEDKPLWAQILSRPLSGISKDRLSRSSVYTPDRIGETDTEKAISEGNDAQPGTSIVENVIEMPNLAEMTITSPSLRRSNPSRSPPPSPFASSGSSSAIASPTFSRHEHSSSLSSSPEESPSSTESWFGFRDYAGQRRMPGVQPEVKPRQKRVRFTSQVSDEEDCKGRKNAEDYLYTMVRRIVGSRHDDYAPRLPLEDLQIEDSQRVINDHQRTQIGAFETEFILSALGHWYRVVKESQEATEDNNEAYLHSEAPRTPVSLLFPRNITIVPADALAAHNALKGHQPRLELRAAAFRHNEDVVLLYGRLLAGGTVTGGTTAPPQPTWARDLKRMLLFVSALDNYVTLSDAHAGLVADVLYERMEATEQLPVQLGDLHRGCREAERAVKNYGKAGNSRAVRDALERQAWFEESIRLWEAGHRPPAVEKNFVYIDRHRRLLVWKYRKEIEAHLHALGRLIRQGWPEITQMQNTMLEGYDTLARLLR